MPQSIRPREDEDRVTVGGDEITFRCTSEQSGDAIAAFEVRMPPGGGPRALHRHSPFELYNVLDGELTFYLEGPDGGIERSVAGAAGPNSIVAIPAGSEHTIRNESDAQARAFVVFSPGGEMERFAREAGALAASGRPTSEEIMTLAHAHGIEITRPLDGSW
jgi:oxalate decarboxylase/phosphoglucose isomerase-like protein (cupin superfamily)